MMSIEIGERFGRLVVIADSGERTKAGGRRLLCRCDCGTEKVITAGHLRDTTRSCGCLRRKSVREKVIVQRPPARQKGPTQQSWRSMITRCTNPNTPYWRYYGGLGTSVCERWRGDAGFANFVQDMGERPAGMTLDRIDSDGNYEPGNCRWATHTQQMRNQRRYRIKLSPETLQRLIASRQSRDN